MSVRSVRSTLESLRQTTDSTVRAPNTSSSRRRSLDRRQLVSVLEAFYGLHRPDDERLFQSLFSFSRVAGGTHDYTAFFYDASDVENPKVGSPCRLEPLPPELVGVWGVFQSTLTPAFARATFRS